MVTATIEEIKLIDGRDLYDAEDLSYPDLLDVPRIDAIREAWNSRTAPDGAKGVGVSGPTDVALCAAAIDDAMRDLASTTSPTLSDSGPPGPASSDLVRRARRAGFDDGTRRPVVLVLALGLLVACWLGGAGGVAA